MTALVIPGPLPWYPGKPGLLHAWYVVNLRERLQWRWHKVPTVPSTVPISCVAATMTESVCACQAISGPISHIPPALNPHVAAQRQDSLSWLPQLQ